MLLWPTSLIACGLMKKPSLASPSWHGGPSGLALKSQCVACLMPGRATNRLKVRAFDHRHAFARTRNVPRSGRSLHMVYFVNVGGTTIERAVNESRSKGA